MALRSQALAKTDLAQTLTTYYSTPTSSTAVCTTRILITRLAFGANAGAATLKIEDNAGTPTSHFLMNAVSMGANQFIEIRDLILPEGWKLRAFANVADVDIYISGVENLDSPTNPDMKVLGRLTLSGSLQDVYTCPAGKRALVQHMIIASAATGGSITTILNDTTRDTYIRNAMPIAANSIMEDHEIPDMDAGYRFRASGVGDITLFGYEITV
ncbi:MAG TPA: hypothetical protein V6C65_04485 [Allocoleopsis sp.]